MSEDSEVSFSSRYPISVSIRPINETGAEWQPFDEGPGYFSIPGGYEVCVRVKLIDNAILADLVKELQECPIITCLNLSENRNITNSGIPHLERLKNLTQLNLSSCNLTDEGLAPLAKLKKLTHLNLSYCNRITEIGFKPLKTLTRLTYLDLQGCVRINHAGMKKIERRGLTIHK